MRATVSIIFAAVLLLGSCARAPGPEEVVPGLAEGPVTWPAGSYVVSGRAEAPRGSAATGLAPAQHIQAELYVVPDGTMYLQTGLGTCSEIATDSADARSFRCGESSFSFVTDGTIIRGWATVPMTVTVRSNRRICAQWQPTPEGGQTCVRYEYDTTTRTVRAQAQLAVTGGTD